MLPTGKLNPVLFHLQILVEVLWITICSIPSLISAGYYLIVPRPLKDVKGEIVLVTGAGQGIGRDLCLRFAQLGSEVVCVDLNPEANLETVRMIRESGAKARGYVCDVADRKAVMRLAGEVGRVDILINNAGIYPVKGIWNSTEVEMRTILDVNLMSQLWTVQSFLPGMKERDHGHIVSISSMAALHGVGYMHPYAISKAGNAALMQSLYHEMRQEGRSNIKLTTVYPYFMNTRREISECCDMRLPYLEKEEAVECIFRGILEEQVSFTAPRELYAVHHFTRLCTQAFCDMVSDYFFARMREPEEDEFKMLMANGTLNSNKGTILSQG